MNPGAAGYKGFHKVCTALRFVIDGKGTFVIWKYGNFRANRHFRKGSYSITPVGDFHLCLEAKTKQKIQGLLLIFALHLRKT